MSTAIGVASPYKSDDVSHHKHRVHARTLDMMGHRIGVQHERNSIGAVEFRIAEPHGGFLDAARQVVVTVHLRTSHEDRQLVGVGVPDANDVNSNLTMELGFAIPISCRFSNYLFPYHYQGKYFVDHI
ncbi:hypothetical protein E5345_12945 [Propionibacterium sp. NM47_B9-13]|jgi:hypothetical protein|uniref:Uncharacterized protein n=1 Tax=Cutibacterium modestum HL044PA1 TaxID=765109 RepID=A0ABN0C1W0_9ACTN|nr:hypothetical protein [Cutibacterium modestum]TGY27282.1 hypothetical protein E5345_12945 [Propionibacterium sp. NM47_B9-13]AOH45135.1 hypothetical protein BCB70_03585 [Cutibacterium modestum]EFS75226.1 hypothetical protein HMPREF9621_00064 [Cutibacterium modestum HL037PA2]EFS91111.1 hypothetical protein HMPREF9607_02737 [Cutibacterium modestum HL044PA1]EFT16815.1 hypothetical protein HMPREF9622_00086 [Cutibacterium modestum HL037PA3]